ncbi:Macro domain protein [Pelagimonas phthalicica]|uniref:Macro domain protein n=1 Tax=Pelagimonas phthalicica TaxID=1037362 RepID=A0A238JFV1_9RHOB|nr:macro domain-containing protein [Pelagimonas phthalicica]TDS91794.1 O-acetyl-ADP-ribose deacetylase (regulator of RNase III) [Pelagimonas phthalicica]SMX28842.1 Macro domain protein [Pelagimonas phthalicica]
MRTVKGDLIALALQGEFDVIVHGCNCFHTMGAGIARPIRDSFPEALAADKDTDYGSRDKLGSLSVAEVSRNGRQLIIVNAYTQFSYKGRGPKVDYAALERCFAEIAQRFSKQRIGYPMIGAGLAGGDWTRIVKIIETQLQGLNHTLVEFAPN